MESVTLNRKEQTRVMVLNEVNEGALTAAEAAGLLGVSVRQVRRLLAAYRTEGVAALAHGNRGRQPAHTLDPELRDRIVEYSKTRYAGCNQYHLTDLLAEREGIAVSRSTVRRILAAAGIASPRKRRVPEHRQRRERYPQEGQLIQIDGSPHAWLEERGPRLSLILAVDDATGTVPAAVFRRQEDAHGYLLLLEQLVRTHGCPVAVYHDRHSIFIPPASQKATIEEQLEGRSPMTQVSRALAELGIRSIAAHSPQAKGRIERVFGTFQDRLTSELRLAGVETQEDAQDVLAQFLVRYNKQFAVPAKQAGSAYRPLDSGQDVAAICCFKYVRTVARDNTVKLGEHRLQLTTGAGRLGFGKARVEIQERLDGSLVVLYHDQCIATQEAPADAPVLRARATGWTSPVRDAPPIVEPPPKSEGPRRPGPDHPWRQGLRRRTRQ
jgi:transposase